MSADSRQVEHSVRRERTDETFEIDEPVRDPRVGPRVIPLVVAILIVAAIIVLFYVAPWE